MKNYLSLLITLITMIFCFTSYAQDYISHTSASLQILNKITAQSIVTSIDVTHTIIVDNKIIIKLEACYTTKPNQIPEAIALLQIKQLQPQGNTRIAKEIFHGWMFANHPAISSLEDPLYDVRVLGCTSPKEKITPLLKKNSNNNS